MLGSQDRHCCTPMRRGVWDNEYASASSRRSGTPENLETVLQQSHGCSAHVGCLLLEQIPKMAMECRDVTSS
jgi:hypothetical protein